MNNKFIAIDLGSYNSSVSIYEGNEIKIIETESGKKSIPSYVAYTKDGVIVGEKAKRQAISNPENTIFNIKRLMGKSFESVKDLVERRPYKIVEDENGRVGIEIFNEILTPEEISSKIILELKRMAEEYIGEEIHKAIITVPAHFNTDERESTRLAGEISGLEVLRIISEPTSAVLNVNSNSNKTYVVYDFGGQTFDVSVVLVEDDVYEILSTNGNLELGGQEIDELIVEKIKNDFYEKNNIRLSNDSATIQRLFESAEETKIKLSNADSVSISIPYISTVDSNSIKHINEVIDLKGYNESINDIVDKTIDICKKSLQDADLTLNEVDEVILVGGSTRIPLVREKLSKLFGESKLNLSLNPDTSISTGACVQGGILTGINSDILLLDCLGVSIGIEKEDGLMDVLIASNTTIPTMIKKMYTTTKNFQKEIEVNIYQGERALVKDNKHLGTFILQVESAPRGIPRIEINMEIDSNGILKVSALDLDNMEYNQIRISGSTKLSDEELDRIKKDLNDNMKSDSIINSINVLKKEIENLKYKLSDICHKMDDSNSEMRDTITDSINKIVIITDNKEEELTFYKNKSIELKCLIDKIEEK